MRTLVKLYGSVYDRGKIRENMFSIPVRSVEYTFSDSIRCALREYTFCKVYVLWVYVLRCVSIRFVKYRYMFCGYTFCEYTSCTVNVSFVHDASLLVCSL
jgi:hypothetical protein